MNKNYLFWFGICSLILLSFIVFNIINTQAIRVRAVGEGFYWNFIYAGEDNEFNTQDDFISEQVLILPINQEIELDLTSQDYIYMFKPDGLSIKEVAVPELTFNLKLNISQTNNYPLEVDPMCGFNFLHDNPYMGMMNILTKKEYEQWLESKKLNL